MDPYVLAESLRDTAKHLNQHIDERARQIAEPHVRAATVRERDLEDRIKAWERRFNDLRAEHERQITAMEKTRAREFDELKRLRAAVHRVRFELRTWTRRPHRDRP